MDEDPMNTPRGIVYGILFSAVLWAIVLLVVVGFFA